MRVGVHIIGMKELKDSGTNSPEKDKAHGPAPGSRDRNSGTVFEGPALRMTHSSWLPACVILPQSWGRELVV